MEEAETSQGGGLWNAVFWKGPGCDNHEHTQQWPSAQDLHQKGHEVGGRKKGVGRSWMDEMRE